MTAGGHKKRVVVFRKDVLPISETFIQDQFNAYQNWSPTLIGYRSCPGIALAGDNVMLLQREQNATLDSVFLKLAQHAQYWNIIYPRFLNMVRRLQPALIHAHFGYDAVLVYDIARRLQLPLVVTLHGTDISNDPESWASGRHGFFFRRYPKKLRRMFADEYVHFITVSHALRERALERGAPGERTVVRYTGIDCAQFPISNEPLAARKTIVFVGRLIELKGCEILLKAMHSVQATAPDAQLIIIGDGPLRHELEALAERLQVSAIFMGKVSRSAVREQLHKARAFCLPSITDSAGAYEAFGMVILEAQASGVPVITSARGGIEGIVDGKTGFVFRERDVAGLADCIGKLVSDDALFTAMSAAASAHVRSRFDVRQCTLKIEAFYDSLLPASCG